MAGMAGINGFLALCPGEGTSGSSGRQVPEVESEVQVSARPVSSSSALHSRPQLLPGLSLQQLLSPGSLCWVLEI